MTRSIATIHIIITRSKGTALDSLDYEFLKKRKFFSRIGLPDLPVVFFSYTRKREYKIPTRDCILFLIIM